MECAIEPLTGPSYVSASYRRLIPGNGCSDDNATSSASSREIHLVRLASPVQQATSPRKESRGPKKVDLRIVAEDSAGRTGKDCTHTRDHCWFILDWITDQQTETLTWEVFHMLTYRKMAHRMRFIAETFSNVFGYSQVLVQFRGVDQWVVHSSSS